jgi:glycerol kinase
MLEHRPEVRERARAGAVVFATVDALVVNHLTAGRTLATDPTNASRTQLLDIDGQRWDDELCALVGGARRWLPDRLSSTAHFGDVAQGPFAGVPIHGVAGDQQAALYGQGCWDAGGSKATYGTGCFLLVNTGRERRDSRSGLLTTLGVAADGGTCYALEGAVFAAGTTVQWLRDQAGFVERSDESEALARSVPDTGGVFLVPAFAGLGAPYWDPDARAAILGITRGTTRAHVVRAGLEAIAFRCAELIELFRAEGGTALDELRVDGGASANGFLMQTQADLSGVTVVRPGDVESTARGAALLAGVGAGVVRDPAALPFLTQPAARFEPALDAPGRARRMAEWRAAVARVLTRPAPP